MTGLIDFVEAHQTVSAVVAMWLFSNLITALPSPSNDSGGFYKFTFAFAHGLAGSLPRIFPAARVFDPTSKSGTYFQKGNGNGTANPVSPPNSSEGGN